MNFYKKYETLNDIPEPFRRTRRAAEPIPVAPTEPAPKEAAVKAESVKESRREPEADPQPAYEDQSVKQQNTKVPKGNQDLIFLMLMFMLLTE